MSLKIIACSLFLLNSSVSVADPLLWKRQGRADCWWKARDENVSHCISREAGNSLLKAGLPFKPEFLRREKEKTFLKKDKRLSIITYDVVNLRTPNFFESLLAGIESYREESFRLIEGNDPSGIFRKLFFDQEMEESQTGILRAFGFVHLLSATGIHLYAFLALAFTIAKFFGKGLRLPIRKARLLGWLICLGMWGFLWTLQGFRMGLLRPLLIVVLRKSGEGMGTRFNLVSPLFLAMGLDFALDPELNQGDIHYFFAVLGGYLSLACLKPNTPSFHTHLALSVGSWLLSVPIDLALHSRAAIFTPILSLITIPFFCSFVYPLGLVLILFPLPGAFESLEGATVYLLEVLTRACLQFGNLWTFHLSFLPIAVALASAGLFCRSNKARALLLSCVILIAAAVTDERSETSVEQLNVGQGDSALITWSDGRHGLVDVGSALKMRAIDWLDVLGQRSVARLDFVVLTHLDEDHAGSLIWLSKLIGIECVDSVEKRNPNCAPFRVQKVEGEGNQKQNSKMLAVAINVGDQMMYVNAGDASAGMEEKLLPWLLPLSYRKEILLKVSHHGSRFSTSEKFLDALKPKEAWISSGASNRYGHPSAPVLRKLEKRSIKILRTDRDLKLKKCSSRQLKSC